MLAITRERGICMFYHQQYEKSKANKLLTSIESLDLEICYKDDPCKPFLLYTKSINADPYPKINEASQENVESERDTKKISKFWTKKKGALYV